jgi:predicted acetyltransferase
MIRLFEEPRYTLEPCILSEFDDLMRFLDNAFAKPEKRWFEKNFSHIFQHSEKSVECHKICRSDGVIAGAIGIYPIALKLGSSVLNVGGIGSVSVDPNFRGRGIMSQMIPAAICLMENAGYDISWLGGDRFRYRNHGWDIAGRKQDYHISTKDLSRYLPSLQPSTTETARGKHIERLSSLYARYYSTVFRSNQSWAIQLKRPTLVWLLGTGPSGDAYLAHYKGEPKSIVDIQGENADAVAALLMAHLKKEKIAQCIVSYPQHNDPVSHRLAYCSAWVNSCPNGQIKIINIDSCWKKILPEIKKNYRGKSSLDIVKSESQRQAVLNRTFGHLDFTPPLPGALKPLEDLKPLNWWMSTVDQV